MSLPHALLGLLTIAPASGYDLTKEFERELGRYAWHAGHTSVYPELNRLAERGLVEVTEEGPRGRRTYAVTQAGREELRTWLLTPRRERAVRNEPVLRMFLLSALEPDDARRMLQGIAKHTAREAAELREIMTRPADPERGPRANFGRLAAEFGVRQYDAVHEWALWALDQLDNPG